MPARDRRDLLVDTGLAEAAISDGRPAELVVAEFGRLAITSGGRARSAKPPVWAPWEEDFLAANLGLLSLEAIGEYLGRSAQAIKIRYKRKGWPAPSRREGWLTGNRAAKLLRVDGHAVVNWVRRGWIPHRRTPNIRADIFIKRQDLYRWALDPQNWLYFHPERVRDPHLRRLLELQRERWADEWWTTRQVADYHGVDHTDVNRFIQHGRIRSVKWGNRHVLRSEALKPGLYFDVGVRGKGSDAIDWSDEGDAFLIRMKAAGTRREVIARMMRLSAAKGIKQLDYHLRQLHLRGQIPWLIGKYDLPVEYDPTTGALSLTEEATHDSPDHPRPQTP